MNATGHRIMQWQNGRNTASECISSRPTDSVRLSAEIAMRSERGRMSKKTKTVVQIIEEVKEDICNHYCKYPDIWDEEEQGTELIDSEYCQKCPLNKL